MTFFSCSNLLLSSSKESFILIIVFCYSISICLIISLILIFSICQDIVLILPLIPQTWLILILLHAYKTYLLSPTPRLPQEQFLLSTFYPMCHTVLLFYDLSLRCLLFLLFLGTAAGCFVCLLWSDVSGLALQLWVLHYVWPPKSLLD